ncbi:MAG: hypothetical protein EOP04_04455 [Proteobacteria bacterium]|nr:MAG: hypothetical protein EOP04_04455 [Pseudomonadota bacterium]
MVKTNLMIAMALAWVVIGCSPAPVRVALKDPGSPKQDNSDSVPDENQSSDQDQVEDEDEIVSDEITNDEEGEGKKEAESTEKPVPEPIPAPEPKPEDILQPAVRTEGMIVYFLHGEAKTQAEKDAHARIRKTMDKAVAYYNKYTNLYQSVDVYYDPGVPTAQAHPGNNGGPGQISFGGQIEEHTGFHELAHTFGVGFWGNVMRDGFFHGDKTNAVIRKISNDPNAVINGDGQHFWPYGLNFAGELKSEKDLIFNAKVTEAINRDIASQRVNFNSLPLTENYQFIP